MDNKTTHPVPNPHLNVTPNFITEIIDRDLEAGKYTKVVTRFPPNPNGFGHIGHAFALCLNFGIAADYQGQAVLRLDDTNPETDKLEYVQGFFDDFAWLGWTYQVSYASDYFEALYGYALKLIEKGLAYVDSVPKEDFANYRGTVDTPDTASPFRERSIAENLELFARMRAGEFPDGTQTLRAKLDLASSNMKLRDPVLYRIVHRTHYRTGDAWCIYPSYDFAQALTDALDGVTHSLCSLEFIDNRAVYDWLLEQVWEGETRPHQYEFGRRSLEYTVVSKRKLIRLVENQHLEGWNKPFVPPKILGWDDPRMPTMRALRRRGVRPEALRAFAKMISVSRTNRTVDLALLEGAIRDDLNGISPRVMGVLHPIKVVITNYPQDQTESLEMSYWPHDIPLVGSRAVPFSRELYLEQDDFSANPPKGFKRLTVGGRVRLRQAYVLECTQVITDDAGEILELHCVYLPETLGSEPREGKKPSGVIHWLSAQHAVPAEFRLYDRLFNAPHPDAGEGDFLEQLNPHSLEVAQGFIEPSVVQDPLEQRYQLERLGFFWRDPVDSGEKLVFNRIITLKDAWGKTEGERAGSQAGEKKTVKGQPRAVVEKLPEKSHEKPAVNAPSTAELERVMALAARGIGAAEVLVLAREVLLLDFLEQAVLAGGTAPSLANWIVNELAVPLREGQLSLTPHMLATLVNGVDMGQTPRNAAKDALQTALETGKDPNILLEQSGTRQINDETALEALILQVMAQNPDKVTAYRSGKTGLLGFFLGQVMKASQGQANGALLEPLARKVLAESAL